MEIYAKNFLLTYPRCELHPEYVLQSLLSLQQSANLVWAKVVQEEHEDGGYHIHAVLGYDKRLRVRDSNYFDIYFDDVTYHGNYQACKSVGASLKYIGKDIILSAEHGEIPSEGKSGKTSAYALAMETAKSAEDYYQIIRANAPRDAALYENAIRMHAERHYGGGAPAGYGPNPDRPYASFRTPAALQKWVDDELNVPTLLTFPNHWLT